MTEALNKYFVIDFDSTFTRVEALDVLGEISLAHNPEKEVILQKIKELTDQGMDGGLSLNESLEARLKLLQAHRDHLPELIERLRTKVSASFKRNRVFFDSHPEKVYIISNGFKEFIVPIVTEFGIAANNVYANTFKFDEAGNIIGYDEEGLMASNNGKAKQVRALELKGEVMVIGDGYTDYEIKKDGAAKKFYAFTENVQRQKVLDNADHIAPDLDEILYVNKMERALSFPKSRIKVLLLENIHEEGIRILKEEGYQVEIHPAGLDEDELAEKIKDVSIIGIRSKTHITPKVLANANRLLVVGAFCIGTNQIDLEGCLNNGVAVFNAPFSNTRSVVELAIGEIIMLIRDLPDKMQAMHDGRWNKSAVNSFEIRGKKLGIIGYGNIGAQLSVVAESLGMQVYYYDIEERLGMGNATKCDSLKELLNTAEVITLHVDGRPENKDIIGAEEFGQMKNGAIFLNLSRGHVVDIKALSANLESGKIKGAAIDVYPEEPKSNSEEFISELRKLPNTILTPHIGGSTLEAQQNIAQFVPGKIIDYINTGSTNLSVNFPNLQLPTLKDAHRFIHLHQNVPGILAKINKVLAEHSINVAGQYLKTTETVGYVITDINKDYSQDVITDLKKIPETIRFRVLY
ncbi:MAG: phosphoglycerate dehydrogenase [Cyclobacteriaceae bacterium]